MLCTGKERDAESGLDYFGARRYSSALGRFMSPDDGSDQLSEDPQSWNLYNYVRNNPLRNIDPTGNACVNDGKGGWADDKSGGESCAGVDRADKNIPASATVTADAPQLSVRESARQDGINAGFLGPGDLFFIRMPEFGILGKLGRIFGGAAEGSAAKLTGAEAAYLKELEAAGHAVEQIPRGAGKSADFLVDGVSTELKTITSAGPNTIKNAIETAAKQGKKIVIDARNVEVSADAAMNQIQRAQGNISGLAGRVTVLTKEGPVRF